MTIWDYSSNGVLSYFDLDSGFLSTHPTFRVEVSGGERVNQGNVKFDPFTASLRQPYWDYALS